MEQAEDTRTVQQLAEEVLKIQDACNSTAVVGTMHRAMKRLLRITTSTEETNQHPITCLYIDKLCHLAGLPQPFIPNTYENVRKLAKQHEQVG